MTENTNDRDAGKVIWVEGQGITVLHDPGESTYNERLEDSGTIELLEPTAVVLIEALGLKGAPPEEIDEGIRDAVEAGHLTEADVDTLEAAGLFEP